MHGPTSYTGPVYSLSTLTHLLNALYISNANLNKTAALLRTHTPDMITETVRRLAHTLSPKVDATWSPTRCARQVVRHFTPPVPRATTPPSTKGLKKGRTIVRLVPADAASADAVKRHGAHPFIEVMLKSSKTIWEVTAHLFAKWGVPIRVLVNGRDTSIRTRLASFLADSDLTPDTPPDAATPVINATFMLAEPRIPARIFKAARKAGLLPDAPPTPPPLPPTPRGYSKKRTYAVGPSPLPFQLHAESHSTSIREHTLQPRTPSVCMSHSASMSQRLSEDYSSVPSSSQRAMPLPSPPEPPVAISEKWPRHPFAHRTSEAVSTRFKAITSEGAVTGEAHSTTADFTDNVSASAKPPKVADSGSPCRGNSKRKRPGLQVDQMLQMNTRDVYYMGLGPVPIDGGTTDSVRIPEHFLKLTNSVDVPVDTALPESMLSLGASDGNFALSADAVVEESPADESPPEEVVHKSASTAGESPVKKCVLNESPIDEALSQHTERDDDESTHETATEKLIPLQPLAQTAKVTGAEVVKITQSRRSLLGRKRGRNSCTDNGEDKVERVEKRSRTDDPDNSLGLGPLANGGLGLLSVDIDLNSSQWNLDGVAKTNRVDTREPFQPMFDSRDNSRPFQMQSRGPVLGSDNAQANGFGSPTNANANDEDDFNFSLFSSMV